MVTNCSFATSESKPNRHARHEKPRMPTTSVGMRVPRSASIEDRSRLCTGSNLPSHRSLLLAMSSSSTCTRFDDHGDLYGKETESVMPRGLVAPASVFRLYS